VVEAALEAAELDPRPPASESCRKRQMTVDLAGERLTYV
jgi:hypothetical protein